jgi:hypothetical protein
MFDGVNSRSHHIHHRPAKMKIVPLPSAVFLLFLSGCSSLEPLFTEEVKNELAADPRQTQGYFTEQDIVSLPAPVQRYFRTCGFIGREKMRNAKIEWKEANIKRTPEGGWMPLECVQYNFVRSPARFVYLNAALWGIIPFDGRDKYQNGAGNMYIRVMNLFTVDDASGKEMDQSSLVTILAETMMVPSYALQPYIRWKSVDSLTAEAALTYNGITVKGTFFFNEQGEYIRFESNDRFQSSGGVNKKYPWSTTSAQYKDFGGFKQASVVTAAWRIEKGEYQYWKGEIETVNFNVLE